MLVTLLFKDLLALLVLLLALLKAWCAPGSSCCLCTKLRGNHELALRELAQVCRAVAWHSMHAQSVCRTRAVLESSRPRSWGVDANMKTMGEKELIGRLRAANVPFIMIVIILLMTWAGRLNTEEAEA